MLEAMGALQFEGELVRLGWAACLLPFLGIASGRARQFEGSNGCLGRESPLLKGRLSLASMRATPTWQFPWAIMPNVWLRRTAGVTEFKFLPRPSGWRRCGGVLAPVGAPTLSLLRMLMLWARGGLDAKPPTKQAEPPKRVAMVRRR